MSTPLESCHVQAKELRHDLPPMMMNPRRALDQKLAQDQEFFQVYHQLHDPLVMDQLDHNDDDNDVSFQKTPDVSHRHRFLHECKKRIFAKPHRLTYLHECDKLQLAPRRLKLIPQPLHKVELAHFSIGDQYAQALSSSLSQEPHVRSIDLSSNRLTDASMANLAHTIVEGYLTKDNVSPLAYLNLSSNSIGQRGVRALGSAFWFMTELHLAHNRLKDAGLQILCQVLDENVSPSNLRILNVSHNDIHDPGALALGRLLAKGGQNLTRVNLSWNVIRAKGALSILEGVRKTNILRTLDLSWNAIGSGKEARVAVDVLTQVIRDSTSLVDLNISNNAIPLALRILLVEQLDQSCHLLALHMEESQTLNPAKERSSAAQDQVVIVPPPSSFSSAEQACASGYTRIQGHRDAIRRNWKYTPHCWICEKWNVFTFQYLPQVSGPGCSSIGVWTSVNDWQEALPMTLLPSGRDGFAISCLAPPGNIYFYFELETKDGRSDTCVNRELPTMTMMTIPGKCKGVSLVDGMMVVNVEHVDAHSGTYALEDGWDFEYQSHYEINNVTPKVQRSKPTERSLVQQHAWDASKSPIFRHAPYTTPGMWKKAFDFDWDQLSIESGLLGTEEEITLTRDVLEHYYPQLYCMYKHHAFHPDHLHHISMHRSSFWNLLRVCHIGFMGKSGHGLEFHTMEQRLIEMESKRKWIAPGNHLAHSIVRHEWLEVLLRLARVLSPDKTKTPLPLALKELLTQHIIKFGHCEDPQAFRLGMLHTPENEKIFLDQLLHLKSVFRHSSERKDGHSPYYMSLERYVALVKEYLVTHDHEIRSALQSFCCSNRLVRDEIHSRRHEQLNFWEFIQALGRLAYLKCCSVEGQADHAAFRLHLEELLHFICTQYSNSSQILG